MINIIYRLKYPKFFEESIDNIELDGVVVRPTYLSICKADQRYYQGSRPPEVLSQKLPMALIHEAVGNHDRVVRLPDNFDLRVSSFIELMTVAYQGIMKFKEFKKASCGVLGVWGDGNLGYITALFLKEICHDSEIVVFGKHMENLNLFSFADKVYMINDVPEDFKIDHGFECVGSAASQSAIEQIINMINPQGTINLFGVSEYPIPINTRMVLEKGLTLQGNSRSEREDFEGVVNILQNNPNLFDYLSKLITNVCEIKSIDDLKKSFDRDYISDFGKTVLKWEI